MSDSIFVRVQRVVSGGVGSALDAAERLGGSSVMRQAIREMDCAIEKARTEREAARARRLQAEHHLQACRKQLATLKEQALAAQQRLDLAEVASVGRSTRTQIAALAKSGPRQSHDAPARESVDALKLRRQMYGNSLVEAAQHAATPISRLRIAVSLVQPAPSAPRRPSSCPGRRRRLSGGRSRP